MKGLCPGLILLTLGGVFAAPSSHAISGSEREFFESRIRPILAQECYECHSEATKSKGGLLLDTRAGWEVGGDSGPVIVPGKPEESLLLKSITHEIEDLKMPKAGAQLDHQLIDDFRQWIAMGAPDPRDAPPSPEQLSQDTNWEAIRERRQGWWSFQPIQDPAVPDVAGVTGPVDRFIRARLEQENLTPAPAADPQALHRRLSFALIGLPPTIEESDAFLAAWESNPDTATTDLVDRLLADPAFGERWARHWMDWVRYAETHGSEGDSPIPHAWQYRDYLIRALNADVPYDQLVKEHLAGDLLTEPRINETLKLNESAIGPAHYRMVFHGFAPTDALDERVKFTDDQINTVTKAFLGLTVSCARCHDHKFDAISQADYYAMFGIFTSGLPATVAINAPGVLELNRDRLLELKTEIRKAVAGFWLYALAREAVRDDAPAASRKLVETLTTTNEVAAEWERVRADWESRLAAARRAREVGETGHRWDLSDPAEAEAWTQVGEGLNADQSVAPGGFVVGLSGSLERILPGGIYSHELSTRHRGFVASPPYHLGDEYDLYLHVAGEESSARFAVQHYPRRGTVYPVTDLKDGAWKWIKYDRIDYWKGDEIHLELATAGEAPILVKDLDRSWFGVREAFLVKKGAPSPALPGDEWIAELFATAAGKAPQTAAEVEAIYRATLRRILGQWQSGDGLTDAGALLLDDLLQAGFFPDKDTPFAGLLEEYRALEAAIPLPTRAPGITERPGIDQPLFVRGNHKEPGEPVARRFLEAIDETPYGTSGSGRLELAADFLREDNPFTARVAVNRVWTHLFGDGLVATVDNFGRLGEEPSHPQLLDFLATRFRGEMGWSLKSLVREVVLSATYQQASDPSPEAAAQDPDNRLLSHFPVRRLDAESIRDALLSLSGELDRTPFGLPEGESSPRRALYLRVARNNLHPLLTTFDFPVPASTVGKRDSTNVPAQSLTMLNDPFIAARAAATAVRAEKALGPDADDEALLDWLFRASLNREPTDPERDGAQSFLLTLEDHYREEAAKRSEITAELTRLEDARRELIEPVQERLLAAQREQIAGDETLAPDLKPVARWEFTHGLSDLVGEASLSLEGSARIEGGALVLDGAGYAKTRPLTTNLGAKTLEALVQLETLEQKGGGVLTVQDGKGILFDSIVFAERRPLRWLPGSNNHVRTADFNGEDETEATQRPVRITVTYEEDGTIRGYRDGEPWGEAVRVAALQPFAAGNVEVLLGLRHGTGLGGNRALAGRIFEAALYDRALTPGEVRLSNGQKGPFVSREMVLNALTDAQKTRLNSLEEAIATTKEKLAEVGPEKAGPNRKWQDLVHALMNLKEFIYLR